MNDYKLIQTSKLKPYPNNPRINDGAVEAVANSIKDFGFRSPIIVDKNLVVIAGHTRLKAAKKLKLKEVPVIVADDLTDEQAQALRLADNKAAEQAEWDYELLDSELVEIIDFNMEDYGFEFITPDETELYSEKTADRADNILNTGIATFKGVGYYDIPEIKPIHKSEIGVITEWIGFNYVLSDKEPVGKAVHFFLDDYQFERLWNNPEKYVEKLKEYEAVLSPDFSPYADMPMATQIFNHYRKHWVARYLQECGVKIIPTIRGSTDERSWDWYLEGEPQNSVICFSSMWMGKEEIRKGSLKKIEHTLEVLKPQKVYVYGNEIKELKHPDVEYIETFTHKRFK